MLLAGKKGSDWSIPSNFLFRSFPFASTKKNKKATDMGFVPARDPLPLPLPGLERLLGLRPELRLVLMLVLELMLSHSPSPSPRGSVSALGARRASFLTRAPPVTF